MTHDADNGSSPARQVTTNSPAEAVLFALEAGWQPDPEQEPGWDTADATIHATMTLALDGATDEVATGLRQCAQQALAWFAERTDELGVIVEFSPTENTR